MKTVFLNRSIKTIVICLVALFILVGCNSTAELEEALTPAHDAIEIGMSYDDFAVIISESYPDLLVADASYDIEVIEESSSLFGSSGTIAIPEGMNEPADEDEINSQRGADLLAISTFGEDRNNKGEKVLQVVNVSDVGGCNYPVHFVDDGNNNQHIIQKGDISCFAYD